MLLASKRCALNAVNHRGETPLWCALQPFLKGPRLPTHIIRLAQQLLGAGAIFGHQADARVRAGFLRASLEIKRSLTVDDQDWQVTLERLISGK
jgi:hypothetical protein